MKQVNYYASISYAVWEAIVRSNNNTVKHGNVIKQNARATVEKMRSDGEFRRRARNEVQRTHTVVHLMPAKNALPRPTPNVHAHRLSISMYLVHTSTEEPGYQSQHM